MKSRESLTIQVNLDLRFFLVVAVATVFLFMLITTAGAQEGRQPTTNDDLSINDGEQAQPAPEEAQVELVPPAEGMLPTTNGEWVTPDVLGQEEQSLSTQAVEAVNASGPGRHFYLTNLSYATDKVLTACSPGYHMASLWEILDVSNLTYDVNHPAAHKKADQGFGPPSYWHGWVRTGWQADTTNVTGTGNCANWTSTSNTAYGVSVRLSRTWETAPGDMFTWDANSFNCSVTGPVWCVMD
jgi:hypothetical protein